MSVNLSVETMIRLVKTIMLGGGLVVVGIFILTQGEILLDFLFKDVGWHPYAIASAKVTCYATNAVYGGAENLQLADTWISANEINDNCELKDARSARILPTGMFFGIGGAHIKVRCSEGLLTKEYPDVNSYQSPDTGVSCIVENFELPQTSDINFENKYQPGSGDPDYVLYYGNYPELEAEEAWGKWALVSFVTAVIPVSWLGKGVKYLAKPVAKVGKIVIPNSAQSVAHFAHVRMVKPTADAANVALTDVADKATGLGFRANQEVAGTVKMAIKMLGEFGYHRLDGTEIVGASRTARFVASSEGWLINRVDDVYRFNLKTLNYYLARNGATFHNKRASIEMVEHLEDIGKIDAASRRRALRLIENDDRRIFQILTDSERQAVDAMSATSIDDAGQLTLNNFVDEPQVLGMDLDDAKALEGAMQLSPNQKISVLTPKFLIINDATGEIDKRIEMTAGGGEECAFTLRNRDGQERVYRMEHCKNTNAYNLGTSPANENDKSGVVLSQTRDGVIDLPGNYPGLPDPEITFRARRKGFYAAAPCRSQTSEGVTFSGPSPGKFTVAPQQNSGDDGQIYIKVPVAAEGYEPNFCWHYNSLDPSTWPGIQQLLDAISGTVNIEKVNSGISPWPCHGVIGVSDLNDWMRRLGLPDWFVGQTSGTCGGA